MRCLGTPLTRRANLYGSRIILKYFSHQLGFYHSPHSTVRVTVVLCTRSLLAPVTVTT